MKRLSVVVIISVMACAVLFGACSSNGSNTASSSSPVVSVESVPSRTDVSSSTSSNTVKANMSEWTYEDWKNATDEQKKACVEYFNQQVGTSLDSENIMKIFATNQGKTLSEIITNQKEHRSQTSSTAQSMQQDPGHGAAAGY